MELNELCARIGLFPEVTARVLTLAEMSDDPALTEALTHIGTAPGAFAALSAEARPEERGLDILTRMLRAALVTRERYRERGIGENIFLDTMGCFSRFVSEHRASFGIDGFDRGFWAYRQLSMVLFRVGSLEYELRPELGEIHLHIPSDADLDLAVCADSLAAFRRLAREQYPAQADAPITMGSWLLSPALEALLPPQSRILRFQRCFDITRWDRIDPACLQWVFGRSDLPLEALPERTSLQKRMKAHLLAGKSVGSGEGRLRSFSEAAEIK